MNGRTTISCGAAVMALTLSAAPALAACTVEVEGKTIQLGRFPLHQAYKSCMTAYKARYVKKNSDKDSELYLRCSGSRQLIATVQDGKFFETRIQVSGCIIPKTLGGLTNPLAIENFAISLAAEADRTS
ncbi:hypothetical protein GCM10007923_11160 [Shinella yambaruensis]|uniref:Uncharacterized protein n=1 Tax=Shinella yambaruensis TaxID=415996 RepID=A0ABQ5ZCZ2_9HYPH|nr:hypothetical protein GCM10007923_11160 [Shinella yambaruensis]